MLSEARRDLGLVGRPNRITKDYASRHGEVFLRAPWCAMAVTKWGRGSGNASAVLPAGDRAYTVWFAEDGRNLGRWYPGTAANIRAYAKPGAIVFFDWGGTDDIAKIDHVGVVEVNLGDGRIQSIEGNTGDACKRRVRASNVIAGFWNPPYQSPQEEDDVSAKDVWTGKIKVPYANPDKPEWQAGTVLTNHGTWLRKVSKQVDALAAQVAAQNATIKALADALAARDSAVNVDALIGRIRSEIANVTVRLDVAAEADPPA